eukprot:scaffold27383_cov48-Phaeocystis_antarctica.AAC.2
MSQSPRPPSDSPWPEGEEQRNTICGRALVEGRSVLASGIYRRRGSTRGRPNRSGSWAYVAGPRRIAAQARRVRLGEERSQGPRPPTDSVARGRRAEKYHRRPSPGRKTKSVGLRRRRRGSLRGRPNSTRATDLDRVGAGVRPGYPQRLCESQHPLQRSRGLNVAGPPCRRNA